MQCLNGKPEVNRPLGGSSIRLEFNIKVDLKEIVWGSVDLLKLAQDRDKRQTLMNMVMNIRVL